MENLSPHNAINKDMFKNGAASPYLNAVRMMLSAGQESVIKGMFVLNQDQASAQGGYQDRINSGLHQVRLYINGEQKIVSVDDLVPRVKE